MADWQSRQILDRWLTIYVIFQIKWQRSHWWPDQNTESDSRSIVLTDFLLKPFLIFDNFREYDFQYIYQIFFSKAQLFLFLLLCMHDFACLWHSKHAQC